MIFVASLFATLAIFILMLVAFLGILLGCFGNTTIGHRQATNGEVLVFIAGCLFTLALGCVGLGLMWGI